MPMRLCKETGRHGTFGKRHKGAGSKAKKKKENPRRLERFVFLNGFAHARPRGGRVCKGGACGVLYLCANLGSGDRIWASRKAAFRFCASFRNIRFNLIGIYSRGGPQLIHPFSKAQIIDLTRRIFIYKPRACLNLMVPSLVFMYSSFSFFQVTADVVRLASLSFFNSAINVFGCDLKSSFLLLRLLLLLLLLFCLFPNELTPMSENSG